jgi:hypothetical protein
MNDWLSAFNAVVPGGTAEASLYTDLAKSSTLFSLVRKRQVLT